MHLSYNNVFLNIDQLKRKKKAGDFVDTKTGVSMNLVFGDYLILGKPERSVAKVGIMKLAV